MFHKRRSKPLEMWRYQNSIPAIFKCRVPTRMGPKLGMYGPLDDRIRPGPDSRKIPIGPKQVTAWRSDVKFPLWEYIGNLPASLLASPRCGIWLGVRLASTFPKSQSSGRGQLPRRRVTTPRLRTEVFPIATQLPR
jgi:hypothetical protein